MTGDRRGGFTLWETALVLAVLAVTLVLAVPAIAAYGSQKPRADAAGLLALLRQGRREAVESGTVVAMWLDPVSGRFRMDTTGVAGKGEYASGTMEMGGATVLVTDLARVQFLFQPTGAAFADSVGVRGPNGTVMVQVDAWNGVAHADPR